MNSIFLNSILLEKSYKIFKNKADIYELPDDSTNLFQCNMLDRYLDRQSQDFENGKFSVEPRSVDRSSNYCQPVDLDDALMESSHYQTKFPEIISLMSSKEKLACR